MVQNIFTTRFLSLYPVLRCSRNGGNRLGGEGIFGPTGPTETVHLSKFTESNVFTIFFKTLAFTHHGGACVTTIILLRVLALYNRSNY